MRLPLDSFWNQTNRLPVLLTSAGIIVTIALVDWWTKPYVSLGLLYLFPLMLAAGFLPRPALLMLGFLCALLSEIFSSLDPTWRISRLILQTLALAGCGLFTSELVRNRRLNGERQQRLRALVETSPAAIVTIDGNGIVELGNQAAAELLVPTGANLVGQSIDRFIPALRNALQRNGSAPFRTSMQCQGRRDNGDTFVAEVWFSAYQEKGIPKLAAIIADVTEEQDTGASSGPTVSVMERPTFNSRQVAVLRLVFEGFTNKEIAARLGITASAVKNTLEQLFTKSGVNNRSQMVRVALERYRDLL